MSNKKHCSCDTPFLDCPHAMEAPHGDKWYCTLPAKLKSINEMEKQVKLKTHIKDIKDGNQLREEKTFVINGKAYWADRTTKDQHATHDDCGQCGVEFEKRFTYDRLCLSCYYKSISDSYLALEKIAWDGETPLCIYKDEQYFFSVDELLEYCQENEISPEDLKLCLCKTSNLSQIDLDIWLDETHEDWEPSEQMEAKLKEFNEFLAKEPSNTWFQDKFRVSVTSEDINYKPE